MTVGHGAGPAVSTPHDPGQARDTGATRGADQERGELSIGVVLEAFLDWPLEQVLARVVSIEHEDPFVPATTGVPEAARLLRAAIAGARLEPS